MNSVKNQHDLLRLIAAYYKQCKADQSLIQELEEEVARLNAYCKYLDQENLALKTKIDKVKKIPGVNFAYNMFKSFKNFKSRLMR